MSFIPPDHILDISRHYQSQPLSPFAPDSNGVIDSFLATQHALAMFRRTAPNNVLRRSLDRLSNRLTKIVTELRNLNTPSK